jgi:tetratricopeptide (TPR) repeat protein
MRMLITILFMGLCAGGLAAQTSSQPDQSQPSQATQQQQEEQQKSLDRSREAGESSSRDTRIDLSPPKDDAKNHPGAGTGGATDADTGDVTEMHPWNPYRAINDDQVGDFYMKQENYKGAIARYQDALVYKENDAVAHFRLGQCFEKTDKPDEAIPHYQAYLKILPQGPYAKQAKKALEKLKAPLKAAPDESSSQKP